MKICHCSVKFVSSNYEYCCCLSFNLQEESGFTLNLAFTNTEMAMIHLGSFKAFVITTRSFKIVLYTPAKQMTTMVCNGQHFKV